MREKSITITDIAHAAQVSKATVSHFLNGKFESMSPETRARIGQIVESTGFRPNRIARSLKSKRSHQIGLLIADISNPVSAILVRGISDVCTHNGNSLLICCTDNDIRRERKESERMADQHVDGILVNPSSFSHSYEAFADQRIPVVMIDRWVETPANMVTTDNRDITLQTLRHLCERGYRRICAVTERPDDISTRLERLGAFRDFYRAQFGQGAQEAVYSIDPDQPEQTARTVGRLVAESGGAAPAVFTLNGVCLLAVLNAVKQLGLAIPKDIAVCGYDDWPWAGLIAPGITAIAQPSYQVGAEAAKLLFQIIEDGQPASGPVCRVLKSKLVVRGST